MAESDQVRRRTLHRVFSFYRILPKARDTPRLDGQAAMKIIYPPLVVPVLFFRKHQRH
jgi:hypothetical protein